MLKSGASRAEKGSMNVVARRLVCLGSLSAVLGVALSLAIVFAL